MKVISFAQIKGGVGKTAMCILAARYLTAIDRKVLVVDSDIQRYSTQYVSNDPEVFGTNSLSLAIATKDFASNIYSGDSWDLLPANLDLIGYQCRPENNFYRRHLLPELDGQYDYVLIDVPSGMDFFARNAAAISNVIVVPVTTGTYEIQAGMTLMQQLHETQDVPMDRYRIVLNMFVGDPARPSKGTQEILDYLVTLLGEALVDQLVGDPIPRQQDIHDAVQRRSPISDTKTHAKTYAAVTEVIQTITGDSTAAPKQF